MRRNEKKASCAQRHAKAPLDGKYLNYIGCSCGIVFSQMHLTLFLNSKTFCNPALLAKLWNLGCTVQYIHGGVQSIVLGVPSSWL